MTWNRRRFLSTSGAAAVGLAAASLGETRSAAPAAPASRSAALFLTEDDGLKPATYDRLPLEWHQARLKLLQSQLAEDGYAGILLSDRWNIIYFTGLFFTSTERPFRVYLPADRLAAIWFYPGIDRDLGQELVGHRDRRSTSTTRTPTAGFPNEGKVQQGATVDIFEWTLQGLKKRGLDGKRLATDWELSRGQLATAGEGLRQGHEDRLGRRPLRKDADGQDARGARALAPRLPRLRRDARLRARPAPREGHGPDGLRARRGGDGLGHEPPHGDDQARRRLAHGRRHRDGHRRARRPRHRLPASRISSITTRSRRARPLQIAGGVEIGGCGGELYRAFLIAPWTDHQKKLWTVSRDCCLMQKDLSRAGVACSTVAYQIHQHQVKEGVQKYIYHRPAHGMGMEGHQPPYLALGDYTMLEPGMIFSVEPGLYDPEGGFGVNFSDGFCVTPGGKPSLQMSRLPWSEDWCLVKL